jgi:hypothetical protein
MCAPKEERIFLLNRMLSGKGGPELLYQTASCSLDTASSILRIMTQNDWPSSSVEVEGGLGQKGSHPFHVPNCSRIFYFKCLELIPILRFITLKVNLGDIAKKTKTNYPDNRLQITPDHLAKPLPLNNKLSKYLLWWHPLYR